jgi:CubicO group peptidase (beta-lactamase class C family)
VSNWRKAAAITLAALLLTAFGSAAQWPSPEQVELVMERRKSFPVDRLVKAVDWYEPLEVVAGAPRSLPARPAQVRRKQGLADAQRYAEQHESYALLVWRDGALQYEHYWPGFDATSRYDTASMHKTVAALLLGAAIADGRIGSVDDPLERYLPELAGTPRGSARLRALLEMASGIVTPPVSDDPASPYWQSYFGDDLRQAIARWPLRTGSPPEFTYANANTQYLGWAIEAATGRRYGEYLSERLWRPIGASDARLWLDRKGGSPRIFCCLQATARDWLRVGLLILNEGRVGRRQVIPRLWIRNMATASPANPNYGWHIWRGSPHQPQRRYGRDIPAIIPAARPFLRDDVLYLDGSGGQRVYIIPSEDLVIVRIGAASRSWDDSALPNLILREGRR